MSTELERRLKVLEKQIVTTTPCRHPIPIVHTDEEADAMIAVLDECPRCSQPSFGPRVLIIRFPKPTRDESREKM